MRQILIDFARSQDTRKRGQRSPHLDLAEAEELAENSSQPVDFIDLDAALNDRDRAGANFSPMLAVPARRENLVYA
jgi:hypothetical protein